MDVTLSLPEEVLSGIFRSVQAVDPHTYPRRRAVSAFLINVTPRKSAALGWINVTFVNRRWRRVALNHAALWTHIDGRLGRRWAREFLRRSKNAPLSIDDKRLPTEEDRRHDLSLRNLLAAHHSRIAILCMDEAIDADSLTGFMKQCLRYSFESLQELKLNAWDIPDKKCRGLNSFLAHLPRLRRLLVHLPDSSYLALDWTYPCLAQLASLNIQMDVEKSTFLNPYFLDVLRRMPVLAELIVFERVTSPKLLSCSSCSSSTSDDADYLKNLHSLVVSSNVETHVHLLRHLPLPMDIRLGLIPSNVFPGVIIDSATHEALGDALEETPSIQSNAPSFTSAHMSISQLLQANTAIATLALNCTARPSCPPAIYQWRTEMHEWLGRNNLILSFLDENAPAVLSPLHTTGVRALTLHDAGLSYYNAHLPSFPNVERLRLCVTDYTPSMHGLRFLENPEHLPQLRLIDLHTEDFDLLSILTSFTSQGPHAVPDRFPALEDVLDARRQAGGLQAIYIHVAEEVALIKAGSIGQTSCKDLQEGTVLESVRRLEAVRGVELVTKSFDIFSI